MIKKIINRINNAKIKGEKLLAILLDPDKLALHKIETTIATIKQNSVDFIFVGGSTVSKGLTDVFVRKIKEFTPLPIVIFPGDHHQITNQANALLFLSLLSGRNPEYLIGQQIKAVQKLKNSMLEIIPTGYLLIDGGVKTAVQRVSKTQPLSQKNIETIVDTAMAGEFLGMQLIYLEAGSGATLTVNTKIIKKVSEHISIPLIVGGGIKTKQQLQNAYQNGADLVVIGTAFEKNNTLLTSLL